jgi:hypothetical protein
MGGIFIDYRGEDSQMTAALIDRELTARFGSDQVFLNSRSIPAGSDFAEELPLRRRYTEVDLGLLVKRIADAEPELAKAAARRQLTATLVPQRLPASVAYFADRSGELAVLTGLLRQRVNAGGTVVISVISGTARVGKPKPGL